MSANSGLGKSPLDSVWLRGTKEFIARYPQAGSEVMLNDYFFDATATTQPIIMIRMIGI